MKNSLLVKIILILTVVLAVSHIGICEAAGTVNLPPLPEVPISNSEAQSELVLAAIKFGKVMLGVVLASVVIYILLLFWNMIVVHSRNTNEISTSLSTPKNIEKAILFFINKNRLK